MYICDDVCVWVFVCIPTYICQYIYAYTHTQHTHTFMCVNIDVYVYVYERERERERERAGAGRRLARRAPRNAAVMQSKLIFCQQVVQGLGFRGSGLGFNPEEIDGLLTGFADSSTAMPPGVTAFPAVGIAEIPATPAIPACRTSSPPAWNSLSLPIKLSLSLSPPLSPSWPSLGPCFSLNLATKTGPRKLESPSTSSP
jgi:hypothetical protein